MQMALQAFSHSVGFGMSGSEEGLADMVSRADNFSFWTHFRHHRYRRDPVRLASLALIPTQGLISCRRLQLTLSASAIAPALALLWQAALPAALSDIQVVWR
jgi:hypothetical protein